MMLHDRYTIFMHAICNLQEEKEKAYGVDWKRFGLVSSMFNIFRKFIRLRTVWQAGWLPTEDDSRLDTIIDLLNYLILSELLQAEIDPESFDMFFRRKQVSSVSAKDVTTNEQGFKLFVHEIIGKGLPYLSSSLPDVSHIIPKIISLGEETVEAWLMQLSQEVYTSGYYPSTMEQYAKTRVASFVDVWLSQLEQVADKKETQSHETIDSYIRIEKTFTMIELCIQAALSHGVASPKEWNEFVGQYVEGVH